jgi:hypothetical protein|tara:strand:- start:310 stop:753 length:444 start_codon:yes stop_codon:yes gene_type:complete
LNIDFILNGLLAGFIATVAMSILQVPMYRKWGMTSVLEWHENQVITSKFIKKTPEELLIPSFLFHLLHGGFGGIAFAIVVSIIDFKVSYLVSGTVLGFLFALVVLIIHEPITKVKPLKHPLGNIPVIGSFVNHAIYGAALGYFLILL